MSAVTGPLTPASRFEKIKEYINSEKFQQYNAERTKELNLNRAERKYLERKNNKFKQTINKLTSPQWEIIEEMANTKADEKIEEFKYILDRNISALLIELLPDKTYEEIDAIERYYSELVNEDVEKCNKLEQSWKGNNEMAEKIMQKYENEVKAMCEELAKAGTNQKKAVEELIIKFPKLSKSMITNAYKKIKSDVDKAKKLETIEDPDVADGVEAIMEIIDEEKDEIMVDKVIKEADECVEKAEDKQPKVVCEGNSCRIVDEDIKEANPEVKKPSLKVLSMRLEGENGTYSVCEKGVELQNEGQLISFANEAEFDKWVEEYRQVFRMAM